MHARGRPGRLRLVGAVALAAIAVWVPGASAAGPVTITDAPECTTTAVPCPGFVSTASTQAAPALTVTSIAVRFNDFSANARGDDFDILLTAPGGQSAMLISDAGSFFAFSGINITIAPTGTQLPCESGCPTTAFSDQTTYAAGDYDSAPQTSNTCLTTGFQQGTDAGDQVSQTTTLGALVGTNQPAGNWTLTPADDCGEPGGNGGGSITNWCVVLNGTGYGCSPTSVRITSFTARRVAGGARVALSWRTAQEADVLGFRVYRVQAGRSVRLNARLVAARAVGPAGGAVYRYVDRTAKRATAYAYRLQVVRIDGSGDLAARTQLAAR